jgi:hypothetical protein
MAFAHSQIALKRLRFLDKVIILIPINPFNSLLIFDAVRMAVLGVFAIGLGKKSSKTNVQ